MHTLQKTKYMDLEEPSPCALWTKCLIDLSVGGGIILWIVI